MFKVLNENYNYSKSEENVLEFWKNNKIFEKSISERDPKRAFTFYEGPPTANGRPGIHHVMARTIKDLVCRYKTMRGYQVHRKAGWDTHGLPVEIEIEKKLGFSHKKEILNFGVEKFNNECRNSVFTYLEDWKRMTERIGYWVNLDDAYITCNNEYIESVWWALKKFFDDGLIYKGHKIQPYCPRCETPLSSHEVALGYQDVKDPSVYVKMKAKEKFFPEVGESDIFFLVWTTTPWTLISNVALAVNPDIDYVLILNKGEYLILAKDRLSVIDGDYNIVKEVKGNELANKEYFPIFNYIPVDKKAYYVVLGDFVTTTDGSGIVHIAPAFGEDDNQIGKKYDLPTLQPVDKSGVFVDEVIDFKNKFVKDADPDIIFNLKSRNILYKKETITHSYPHCYRCKSPLLYYSRASWYIKTTSYADKMIELNKTINWVPPEVGSGRFGRWLEENKDWAISRDRFWGTPIPIWECTSCGNYEAIGSIEELLVRSGKPKDTIIDLHKPYVDEFYFKCSKCGEKMERIPEVLDCWFDSGSMPFAQFHYPFENQQWFLENYPSDFISEGIDQTRGWFYTLHAIGSYLFGKPAYKNVISNELILDKDGQKMSKSRGNIVDPFEIISKYGADLTRWYLITNSPPWKSTIFDEAGIQEVQRKFFGTLINTYSFFALYANIDKFNYSEEKIPYKERPEIDRWIISELNTLIRNYVESMDSYDMTKAARLVSDFTIDQLSNWYVRRNRRRFWKSEIGKDKIAAYQTLYECLLVIAKLTAPFSPFISERIYLELNSVTKKEKCESVHLSLIPDYEPDAIDKELEEKMYFVQRVVSLVRKMRAKTNLKVRQPLQKILLPANEHRKSIVTAMADIIKEEINVKDIVLVSDDDSSVVIKKAKPNFKVIGPKFGKLVKVISEKIKNLTPTEINLLEKGDAIECGNGHEKVSITIEDIEIIHEDIPGWLVESDGDLTIALDTTLTDELIKEGLSREFVNRVQNLRKDSNFDVTDRIEMKVKATPKLEAAIKYLEDYIKTETLTVSIDYDNNLSDEGTTFEIEDESAKVIIRKI
ncbi:MAG TPA: isoleucine--tRNA ligase [Ignavibacteria bacterium]